MTLPRTVTAILQDHVTLEVEGIDRMYLNAVVPILQGGGGIAWFFRHCRGHAFASSALMAPMTRAFVDSLERFAQRKNLDVVTFEKNNARMTLRRSIAPAFAVRRACSSSARRRRRPWFSGRSVGGTLRPGPPTPGSFARRRW
jgi:hypothetical protein